MQSVMKHIISHRITCTQETVAEHLKFNEEEAAGKKVNAVDGGQLR